MDVTKLIEAGVGGLIILIVVVLLNWFKTTLQVYLSAVQQMQKDFALALDKRDDLYEERNRALVEAIAANTAQLARLTEECYSEPRTQPRGRTK